MTPGQAVHLFSTLALAPDQCVTISLISKQFGSLRQNFSGEADFATVYIAEVSWSALSTFARFYQFNVAAGTSFSERVLGGARW